MSIFERMLKQQQEKDQSRLKAWAGWKAGCSLPDLDERNKQGERLKWLRRPEANAEPHTFSFGYLDSWWPSSEHLAVCSPEDPETVHQYPLHEFWMTYYEDIEWEDRTQEQFPRFFETRRGKVCETCPAMGRLTMHYLQRSTKQCEVSDLLARFQFKGEEVDERLLMGEMSKGVWICRDCHDRVHKAEKKLKNSKAFDDYIGNLDHQESAWLDINRIQELAAWSAS